MATVGELLIQLSGDSKPFQSAVQQSIDSLTQFSKAAQAAGKEVEKFNAQTISNMAKGKSELSGMAKQTLDSIRPISDAIAQHNKNLQGNQVALDQMALKSIAANVQLKAMTDNLKGLSSALWLTSTGLQQFGRSMLTGFTLPITAAAAVSIKTFADWEKGTVAIQRAASMTREEANKIIDNFVAISQQMPLTVDDMIKAGYAAAQAGVQGETAITNFSKAAVQLSQVGGDALKGMPIEDLANRLAKLSIAFGETGDNWERVNNLASMLLVVAKSVPGGLNEVVEGMKRVAGTANEMGFSMADTTAMIGTLVAAGIPASRAGTELSRVMLDMATNSDKVAEALGYTTETMGEFRKRMQDDVMGVLGELISRYGGVENRVDTITHLQEIFGEVALRSMLPLIQNYDLFLDLQARANQELESGALLSAEFATQANSLSGTMTVFTNSLKSLSNAIGKDLAPYVNLMLKNLTAGLITLVKAWEGLNPVVKAAIFLFATMVAIVGPLALILNTLFINPISGLVTFVTMLGKAVVNLGMTASVGTLATVSMTGFSGAMAAASTAIGALLKGLAILSVQFLAIIAVIAAVAAALYLLGKAFGIKLKTPSMPSIKLPTYKNAPATPKTQGEALDMAQKADKESAEKEQKALEKELKNKQKARDKELKAMEKNIDSVEKAAKAQEDAQQKLVDEQADALKAKKDQWEEEKELEQEKIDAQEAILKTTKKTLEAAKKELDALKKARDAELDNAENRIDYAKMNLENAQNVLKRLKILGKDEYDADYRAAEARVKAWEDAVQLAEENATKIKIEYQKQIDAENAIVDATQEQVDVQEDAIDALKAALEKRSKIVEDEIDVIQKELDTRKDALDSIKKANDEKISILRDEKQARQEALDDEIDVMQENLDAAREKVQAFKDMPVPELPDLAGSMTALDAQVQQQMQDLQKSIGDSLSFGLEATPGGLWDRMSKDFQEAQTKAREEGKNVVQAFFDGLGAAFYDLGQAIFGRGLIDLIWGKGTSEQLENEAAARGTNIATVLVGRLVDTLKSLAGQVLIAIFDAIFGKDAWEQISKMSEDSGKSIPQMLWEGFLLGLQDIANQIWGWIDKTFLAPIRNAFGFFFNTGKQGAQEVNRGLREAGSEAQSIGSNLIQNFINGLKNYGGMWETFSNVRTAIYNNLGSMGYNAWSWGYNLVSSLADGMRSAAGWVEQTIRNIGGTIKRFLESHSPPKEGPLREIDTWGENLVKTYADSIAKGTPYITEALSGITADAMGDVSVDMQGNVVGNMAAAIPANKTDNTEQNQPVPTTTKNIYIQPGQMIASRGEIRSFVRLLKEYDKFEEGR